MKIFKTTLVFAFFMLCTYPCLFQFYYIKKKKAIFWMAFIFKLKKNC